MNELDQWWLYECGQCGHTSTEQGPPVEDICPACEEETITPVEWEER